MGLIIKRSILLLISSFFLLSKECQCLRFITNTPQNVAALRGQRTQLDCTSNSSDTIGWTVTPIGQAPITVINECKLNPTYIGVYGVNEDNGSCSIVVINATINQAGLFMCDESTGFDRPQTAQLVVLDSDLQCSVLFNGGNTSDVAENELIQMSCTVNYTTNLSLLDTIWTDPNGQPVEPTTETTPNGTFQSYIRFTALPDLVEEYSALTYFLPPSNPSSTATNTPSYTYNWTFPLIYVLYCPNEISFSPPSNAVYLGDTLTCSANGYPVPALRWTNLTTNTSIIDGPNITLTSLGQFAYLCTAYNSIRNNECSLSETVTIEVFGYIPPENIASQSGVDVTIKCTQRYQDIAWLFTEVGSSTSVNIAINCIVLAIYSSKYAVDKSNNNCDLIVLNVNSSQAGTYTCQDPFTTDVPIPPSSMLVVLDSAPDCFISPNFTDECETRISCSVKYTGDLTPMMSWTDHNGQPVTNYTYISDENEVYSYIDVSSSMVNDSFILESFTCDTYFDVPPTTPPGGQTNPATNAPDYRFPWNSPIALCNNTHSDRILVQQNNIDASNAFFFNRSWAEYTEGFGSTVTNVSYWIGLETLNQLTNSGRNCFARFDLLEYGTDLWYWAEYSEFVVDSSATNYTFHVGGFNGNTPDFMLYHNGRPFATYDHNDVTGCAAEFGGGFWYYACYSAGINCSPQSNFNIYTFPGTILLQISRLWLLC